MDVRAGQDRHAWDAFLASQPWSPFLQSWTMSEVYARIGQEPIRLEIMENGKIAGICFAHLVPARRGRHLSVPYGPVIDENLTAEEREEAIRSCAHALREEGKRHGCAFVRISPFWQEGSEEKTPMGGLPSPLHMLAEHIWYLDLREASEEALLKGMRKTTRNLIRRAEREGVRIHASADPKRDIAHFLRLHEETRLRHGFTPYSDTFFRAQVEEFSAIDPVACTLYLAEYEGKIIASSVHMHMAGETSYHHGASTHAYAKIPASYLLQWTAIKDALRRGDHAYNFWGIAPPEAGKRHPFAGVTLFKTGFGGTLLTLEHCIDLPLSPRYHVTRAIETVRKWRRGF